MRALIFVGSAALALVLVLAPVSLVAVVIAGIYGIGHQLLAYRRVEVARIKRLATHANALRQEVGL